MSIMDAELQPDVLPWTNELTLLLSLLQLDNQERGGLEYKDRTDDMDWSLFLKLAAHHRVFPALYTNLQKNHAAWIPPLVIRTLQKEYQKNTLRMLHLSAEMNFLCKVLAELNIRTLVLKGPILASDLYGDISMRTSADLDMLVPMQDLEKTEALLAKLGYVKDEYIQTVLNDWKWRHHHVTFFHLHKGIKIEIHWRLGPGPAKEPSFEQLWERRRSSVISHHPVFYLGREDLFLFLISHGARHGWSRLRWLKDIDQIVRQELDVKKLLVLLKQHQHLHTASQALVLASELLSTPVRTELSALIAMKRGKRLAKDALFYIRQMVNLHTDPVPEPVAKYHKRHLFSLMSMQHKLLFVLNFLYPYPEDAMTLRLPKSLHFLYFPLRPFLWAWRKTKKLALTEGGAP